MAKYKKRADGRYHTTIPTGIINDETGQEIRVPVYGRSISEFEANKDAVKAQIMTDTYAYDKDTTFSQYKWHWFKIYIEDTDKSHNRKQAYRNTLKNHTGNLDAMTLGSIRKSHVQEGYNKLNGSPDLQHEYKMTLNQIFECAIEDGLISKNPVKNIAVTKRKKNKKRALTKIERESIKTADLTLQERCFIGLLHYAGLRRQEVLTLTKPDIDFFDDKIRINKAIEFIGERPNMKDTKSEDGERFIDILAPLRPILMEYTRQLGTLLLFPNSQGTIMSKTQYRRFFEKIKLKINTAAGGKHHYEKNAKGRYKLVYDIDMCQGLSAHVFRHEYATILYYSGIDILEAIRLFGHADSKTMTDIYAELRKEESCSKEKLNKYLEEKYS